jgi:hypothetical protein
MRTRTLDSKTLATFLLAAGMGICGTALAIERAHAQGMSSAPHPPATTTMPAGPLPGETAPSTPPATVNPSTPYTAPPAREQPVSPDTPGTSPGSH